VGSFSRPANPGQEGEKGKKKRRASFHFSFRRGGKKAIKRRKRMLSISAPQKKKHLSYHLGRKGKEKKEGKRKV